MPYQIQVLTLVPALVLLFTACGEEDPHSPTASDYYPLAVGNYWVYEETAPSQSITTLRYEVTGQESMEFEYIEGSHDVLVLENTFPGTSDERRIQYLEDDGTRAMRLQHLIYDTAGDLTKKRDFAPGFLRLDRMKISKDEEWTENVVSYTDLMDGSPVTDETKQYDFRVIEEHQEVTVPAGTFNCLVLERSMFYGAVSEIKIYYFAPGVGKVKEITEGDKEENLVEYHVAASDAAS